MDNPRVPPVIFANMSLISKLLYFNNNNHNKEERGAKYYLQEGNQYLLSGKYNDAILSYDAAIQYDPNDYISYYKRATAYLSLGKTNPAIDDFSKILTLKPGFKQALLERAKLYLADGEYKLAKQDLEGANQDDSTKLLKQRSQVK
ncbi:hypothetical protein RMCBS344292_16289 [Rhizopus microsporus]|nr:hypothetical protein RMCBS344292_16289 [Rhizopus microsporus]